MKEKTVYDQCWHSIRWSDRWTTIANFIGAFLVYLFFTSVYPLSMPQTKTYWGYINIAIFIAVSVALTCARKLFGWKIFCANCGCCKTIE